MAIVTKGNTLVTSQTVFEEVFRETSENAEIAASASEYWRPSEKNKERHSPFNSLWIYNADTLLSLRVRLDGNSDNFYDLPPNSSLAIAPEEGQFFSFLDLVNLSAASAIVAGNIRWRVGKAVPRGKIIPLT